jgi:hypothetical protein
MARSRKKTPIWRLTSEDTKAVKCAFHRLERRKIRLILSIRQDVEALPTHKELTGFWHFNDDGKVYGRYPGWMRK